MILCALHEEGSTIGDCKSMHAHVQFKKTSPKMDVNSSLMNNNINHICMHYACVCVCVCARACVCISREKTCSCGNESY